MVAKQVRTCVGCRKRAQRSDLLRFTVQFGQLTFDPERCLPGRGVWVHGTSECLRSGLQTSQLSRSFRASVKPNAAALDAAWKHLNLGVDGTDDTSRVTDDERKRVGS